MDVLIKPIIGVLAAIAAFLLLLCQAAYWYGARDLPEHLPEPRRAYPEQSRALLWAVLGGEGEIEVRRYGRVSLPAIEIGGTLAELSGLRSEREPQTPDRRLLNYVASEIVHSSTDIAVNTGGQRPPTLQRHFMEHAAAIRLSQEWPAARIADAMLETAYFDNDSRGLAVAAQTYFGQPVERLTFAETAVLIVISANSHRSGFICDRKKLERAYRELISKTAQRTAPPSLEIGLARWKHPSCGYYL